MAVTVREWPIEGDSHGALIDRTAVKKKGGGGEVHVPFWPDRYETPRVLYVSTFGLDTMSGPQQGSGRPRYQQSTEALGPQGWTECLQR